MSSININDRSYTSQSSVQSESLAPVQKQKQFWQADISELKLMYSKGMMKATGYVYALVKCLRKDGWWLSFDVKEFSEEYGINQKTLYRAITELASDKDLDFEWSAKKMSVRFGASSPAPLEILKDEKIEKTLESTEKSLCHSQQAELISTLRKNSQSRENILKFKNQFSSLRKSTPETLTQQESCDSTDIYIYKHTHTDNALPNGTPLPHPNGGVCVNQDSVSQGDVINPQDMGTPESGKQSNQIENSSVNNKSLHPNQKRAGASLDNQQTIEEIMSNAKIPMSDKDAFLVHVASTLKAKSVGAALTAIQNNPARANLEYEQWKKQGNSVVPSLATRSMDEMPDIFHTNMRHSLNNPKMNLEKFLRKDYAAEWLDWARINKPEWIPAHYLA